MCFAIINLCIISDKFKVNNHLSESRLSRLKELFVATVSHYQSNEWRMRGNLASTKSCNLLVVPLLFS